METHVSVNAVLYIARSGDRWQVLSRDAPPWRAAYLQFRRIARQSFFRGGAGATIIGEPGRHGARLWSIPRPGHAPPARCRRHQRSYRAPRRDPRARGHATKDAMTMLPNKDNAHFWGFFMAFVTLIAGLALNDFTD